MILITNEITQRIMKPVFNAAFTRAIHAPIMIHINPNSCINTYFSKISYNIPPIFA